MKTKNYFKKKKGSSDIIYIVLTIMVLALLIPTYNLVMGSLNDALQDSTTNTKAKDSTKTLTESWIYSGDVIFAVIYFMLYFGAMILSYFLDVHPLFVISGIIILVLMTWVGMMFADAFLESTAAGTALGDEMNNLPMLNFIMTWFAELNIVLIVAVMIILYKRNAG